jgi:hypothetical protein
MSGRFRVRSVSTAISNWSDQGVYVGKFWVLEIQKNRQGALWS